VEYFERYNPFLLVVCVGMFFASTMAMVTIALVMAVIVTNIYAKKESPERAPDWCIDIVTRFYPTYFNLDGETGSCSAEENRKRKKNSGDTTCSDQLPRCSRRISAVMLETAATDLASHKPEVVIETENNTVQPNRAEFPTENGDRPPLEVVAGYEDGKPEAGERIRPTDLKRMWEKQNRRRCELEWRLVAKFTDRVFFWIFLILSIIVHCALFLQLVPRSFRGSSL